MLEIYNNVKDFKSLCEELYLKYFNKEATYDELLMNSDIFILNKEKYAVEDVSDYINFHKFKASEEDKKFSIINVFDNMNIKIQNKLLKIFEENENYHVILISNQNKVLPTILSRGIKREDIIKENINNSHFDNYPVRYHKVIKLLCTKNLDTIIIDKYLKFYDLLKKEDYNETYLYITTVFPDYDEDLLYEVIQSTAGYKISLDMVLGLQQKLFSNAQKKLQIENFLLNLII